MNSLIRLDQQYKDLVVKILKKHLSPDAFVWVFGSRANRSPKPFSDLDLAIDAGKPLMYSTLIDLKHEFDESALPYKVDLVDWYALDPSFQERINDDREYMMLSDSDCLR